MSVWLLMVAVAMVNGVLRDKIFSPLLGNHIALSVSGILLSALVFLITLLCIPFIGRLDGPIYLSIGLLWVFLVLMFEFVFGHYVAGKAWKEILQIFEVMKGNLFSLVLVITVVSPWLAAKLRGFV